MCHQPPIRCWGSGYHLQYTYFICWYPDFVSKITLAWSGISTGEEARGSNSDIRVMSPMNSPPAASSTRATIGLSDARGVAGSTASFNTWACPAARLRRQSTDACPCDDTTRDACEPRNALGRICGCCRVGSDALAEGSIFVDFNEQCTGRGRSAEGSGSEASSATDDCCWHSNDDPRRRTPWPHPQTGSGCMPIHLQSRMPPRAICVAVERRARCHELVLLHVHQDR